MPSSTPRPLIDPVVVNAVLIAVRQAANILCDRWTLLILLAAHGGVTRFADFRARCDVASRLLTTRLTMLEEQELMVRLVYSRRPLRHGYHLSHMGLALFDVFAAMLRWEQRWHAGAVAPGLVIEHLACGAKAVSPDVRCSACGEPVTARNVILKISQKEMRSMPERATTYRRSTMSVASDSPAQNVPLPHAMELFGDKWSIEVVMCTFVRVNTFSDFQAHTGMSTNILADRLARLTASGILLLVKDSTDQRRGSYRLTEKGLDVFQVLLCIETWADTWLRDRARSPMRLLHEACGQPLHLSARCDGCGMALERAGCNVHSGQ